MKKEKSKEKEKKSIKIPKQPEKPPKSATVTTIVKAGALNKVEASRLRDGILEDFRQAGKSLVGAAVKLNEFIKGTGWIALGYSNMTEWKEAEVNYTEFYSLRNTVKLLEAGVPAASVTKMKLTNIDTLVRQLPPSEWKDEKWLKAAAEMPVADFKSRAVQTATERGTVAEEYASRGFRVPESVAQVWDTALKIAEEVDGAVKMENRIELIVATFMDSPSQTPGKSRAQRYDELSGAITVGVDPSL